MNTDISRFRQSLLLDRRGVSAVEYALILCAILLLVGSGYRVLTQHNAEVVHHSVRTLEGSDETLSTGGGNHHSEGNSNATGDTSPVEPSDGTNGLVSGGSSGSQSVASNEGGGRRAGGGDEGRRGFWGGVGGFFGDVADGAKAVGGAMADGAKAVGGAVWDGAKAVGGAMADGAKAVGGAVWDGTKWVAGAVWDGTKWVAGGVWDGAKTVGGTVADFVKGAVLGDFSDDNSAAAIAGQVAIGFVPIVGQVADARDTVAGVIAVANGEPGAEEQLAAAGAAWIPGVGDGVKAGGKVAKGSDEAADVANGGVAKNSDEATAKSSTPKRDYPKGDGSAPPVEGWEWRGPDAPGGARGAWVNPKNPRESLHPDLNHAPPVGPHWDWNTPDGRFRIFPDGRVEPK